MTRPTLSMAIAIAVSCSLVGGATAGRGQKRQTGPKGSDAVAAPVASGAGTERLSRVQQQRERPVPRAMSNRERLLAARDAQMGRSPQVFRSAGEKAHFTRLRARSVQLKTFVLMFVAGFGGGIVGKGIGFLSNGVHARFRDAVEAGSPLAGFFNGDFLIGAGVAAGITLVVGTAYSAWLRADADQIERGER